MGQMIDSDGTFARTQSCCREEARKRTIVSHYGAAVTHNGVDQKAEPPPPPNPPPEKPPPEKPPPELNPEPLELARGAAVNASYVELESVCIELVKKIGLK